MNTKIELVNFRDLGGIKGEGGKTVACGRLLRSAEPAGLSASDKSVLLDDYRLKMIIDLRTANERKKQPDDALPNVQNIHIDIMKKEGSKVPDPENFLSKLKTPEDTEIFMGGAYESMVSDPAAQDGFREMISLFLSQNAGSILFHCTTGKDRTGLGAAIILTILGVSRADIMKDYLMTNEMRKAHNDQVLTALKKKGIGDTQLEAIGLALNVEEAYLKRSYSTAEKLYGSFEKYIEKGLDVTPYMTKQLREMYLI